MYMYLDLFFLYYSFFLKNVICINPKFFKKKKKKLSVLFSSCTFSFSLFCTKKFSILV